MIVIDDLHQSQSLTVIKSHIPKTSKGTGNHFKYKMIVGFMLIKHMIFPWRWEGGSVDTVISKQTSMRT